MAMNWQYNSEYDSIEIFFDNVPDEEMRSRMKNDGWRWHRVKKCWFNHNNDKNKNFAKEICLKCDNDDKKAIDISMYSFNVKLIACVDCGKMISTHAAYCLNCGAPFDYIKETYVRQIIEKKNQEEIRRELEEKRKLEEKHAREEEQRRKIEEEKERIRRIQRENEQKKRRIAEETKRKEKLRMETILQFREEFGVNQSFMSDEEVERGIDYLNKNAKKIGYANYMVGDRAVTKVGRYDGKLGFKLYKTCYDIQVVYF